MFGCFGGVETSPWLPRIFQGPEGGWRVWGTQSKGWRQRHPRGERARRERTGETPPSAGRRTAGTKGRHPAAPSPRPGPRDEAGQPIGGQHSRRGGGGQSAPGRGRTAETQPISCEDGPGGGSARSFKPAGWARSGLAGRAVGAGGCWVSAARGRGGPCVPTGPGRARMRGRLGIARRRSGVCGAGAPWVPASSPKGRGWGTGLVGLGEGRS